ncbi:MAG: molybdopterin-dependent oxidoreductase [Chloroflexi bacterium]|nr:molybdopterin-dependent oxidoreductase [Chloroflexota bacterium]
MALSSSTRTESRPITTVCQLCPQACGMDVYVENGRIVKVAGTPNHPVNWGHLCAKAAAVMDIEYAADRLTYPMKRVNGNFKRISWDEALDTIVAKLKKIQATDGPRATILYPGALFGEIAGFGLARRFLDIYGSPNVFSGDSMCIRIRGTAHRLTFGRGRYYDPWHSKCILLWGNNPDNSGMPVGLRVWDARAKGAKLIVIDPRNIPIAKKADIHVRPRPGTDAALGLGILNVIINEGFYDEDFVARWTVGFDKLAEHVKQYPLSLVEKITWVPADKIREIARMFAANAPATIVQGGNSLDQCTSGAQTNRIISILEAITGNLDVPGGFVLTGVVPMNQLRLPERIKEIPPGSDKFPFSFEVAGYSYGEGQGMVMPDIILTEKPYRIRAMFVPGSNLVLTWPDAAKMVSALKKLEFLVVNEMFMTETAQLAHLVLPAASFLEKESLGILPNIDKNMRYVMLGKKVVEPPGECWGDLKYWLELSKRMGYQADVPWQTEEEVIDYLLKPAGLSVTMLRDEKPEGVSYGFPRYKEYEKKGFPTASGKVEIYSDLMAKYDYAPLPVYVESPEGPMSNPELAKEYPLTLTTGARYQEFTHSRQRNIPAFRKMVPGPVATVNTATAARYGIKNGDRIFVETKRGRIELEADVTEDILPETVHIAHGWPEANVNLLTDGSPVDPVSGFPSLHQLLCRIGKVG